MDSSPAIVQKLALYTYIYYENEPRSSFFDFLFPYADIQTPNDPRCGEDNKDGNGHRKRLAILRAPRIVVGDNKVRITQLVNEIDCCE